MNFRQALERSLYQFVLLIVFSISLFFTLLPYAAALRIRLSDLFLDPKVCAQIGWIGFALFALLLIGFFGFRRPRSLRVQMHSSVDLSLLRKALEETLSLSSIEVEMRRGKLEIFLPKDPSRSLAEIEQILGPYLQSHFGYHNYFIVSFI